MKYVLASGNRGKLAELQAMLASTGMELVSQSEFNIPEAVEDGSSFEENAIIKARHASRLTGLPAIADDSGLSVDALNGEPGVYSARYAGENATDTDNVKKLLANLEDVPNHQRSARFHCVIALVRNADDPQPELFHGTWEGTIARAPTGENGFGYDPVFWVPEQQCTAAQLDKATKNSLSHRGKALHSLLQQLQSEQ